jgi:putative oxidoreductase
MIPLNYVGDAGRALLAVLFITGGILFFRRGDFAFALSVISSYKLPFPRLLLMGTMAIQLICGAMLLVGWKAGWAASVFLVWLVPATAVFHPFWRAPPAQAPNEMFHFLKNIGIAGGLLMVVAYAGWD